MEIFKKSDYREILRHWIKSQPNSGRGLITQMADVVGLQQSVFSLTMSGSRDLTPDQAFLLAEWMGLLPLEREYLVTLVQIEKASHYKFKTHLQEKIKSLKKESLDLSRRVKHEVRLNEATQQIFYSSWVYAAVRLRASIGQGLTLPQIQNEFKLSYERALKIVTFLLENGLVVQEGTHYKMGPNRTHLKKDSPMIARHHTNWRVKAIERAGEISEEELMFSGPLTCSEKDFKKLRERMAELIAEVADTVKETDPEVLVCFGVDFFKLN